MAQKKTKKKEVAGVVIVIPRINIEHLMITLVGDAPLICHQWSEKAKREMLDKQTKKPQKEKAVRDPEQEYKDSLYEHPGGGYGFPAVAFKKAAVSACTSIRSMTKVLARTAFHVEGDLIEIEGKPTPREDMVRIGQGTADLRYRGEFKKWQVKLLVRYNAGVISKGQIINLFNVAGFGVGVGEWRPERDGSYGMFHVAGGKG